MKVLSVFVLAGLALGASAQAESRKYKVTITSSWDEKAHLGLPGNAHFSPVVAVNHDERYDLLPFGGIAGRGLEDVAEAGQTSTIAQELQEAKRDGRVSGFVVTENHFVRKNLSQSFEVSVSPETPFLSFVTMIAPSPDWVIGLANLRLYSKEQGFLAGLHVPVRLYAINAGTEEGDRGGNFSINNAESSPRQPISFFSPFAKGFEKPFAFVTVTPLP